MHTHAHTLTNTHTHTVTGYSTPSTSTCIQNKFHGHTHTHEHTRTHTHTRTRTRAYVHTHTHTHTHSWITHLFLCSAVHVYTYSTHPHMYTHIYSTSLCPLSQWLGIQLYFTFICIHTYIPHTLTCIHIRHTLTSTPSTLISTCIYCTHSHLHKYIVDILVPSRTVTVYSTPSTFICTYIYSTHSHAHTYRIHTPAPWTGTGHGGDQTQNICTSRLDDFPVHCFEWQVLPFTHVRFCLKFWGTRETLKTCLKSQGLPWKLVEILAVVLVLIPISSVCGSTPSTFICTYIAHRGDQIQKICIARLGIFPVHSLVWQRPPSTPPPW